MDASKEIALQICHSYNITLSHDSLDAFANIILPKKLLRGEEPVKSGEVCDYMYYVERGLVLQYYKKNGKTVTEHISHEGDMVICIESFYTREPSRLAVHMLEPGMLYCIPHDSFQSICSRSYELCCLQFAIMQRSLIISQQKADVLRFENARERYIRTLRENPDIVRRAPLHLIASLLQMTPETLSRIRTAISE